MSAWDVLLWAAVVLLVAFVGSAVVAGVVDGVRNSRQGYWPGLEDDPRVQDACRRHHPGRGCKPGQNHPAKP